MKISAVSFVAVLAFFSFSQASYAIECSYGGVKQLIKDGKFDEAKASIDQCQENKSESRKASLRDELSKAKREAKEKQQEQKN
jgi:hypothetical protein